MNQALKDKIRAKEIQKSKSVLNNLIAGFENPEKLTDAVIKTFIEPLDVPSNKYSRFNRILLFMQGAQDARGSATWQKMKRNPLDWTKQVFIMMPRTMKVKDKETQDETTITTGFFFKGLYDYSNTYGKDLEEYAKIEPKEKPALIDVAAKWGIETKYIPNSAQSAYGAYDQANNEIFLATHNAGTFFHELAHAAHKKIDGSLKNAQDPQQEAIAQLASGVLCQMYDQKMDKYTYDYILHYAKDDPAKAMKLISKVINKVSQVLELILENTSYQKQVMEVQAN